MPKPDPECTFTQILAAATSWFLFLWDVRLQFELHAVSFLE